MLFWKIDDETIRCLINREEIGQMGYDLDALSEDHMQMDEFLDAIVTHSKNYLNWNTENGIQTYAASPLPSDQYLITISCTFADEMIDRDLDQIRKMTNAMASKITEDRIDKIYSLSGEEKEEAFRELARDLHQVCSGEPDEEYEGEREEVEILSAEPVNFRDGMVPSFSETSSDDSDFDDPDHDDSDHKDMTPGDSYPKDAYHGPSGQKNRGRQEKKKINPTTRIFPPKKMTFSHFSSLSRFVSVLNKNLYFPSSLYKDGDNYILLVSFPAGTSGAQASSFVLTAEEYGAKCSNISYDPIYYSEHGRLLIKEDGIRLLSTM